jgi:hypothetical protein
MIVILPNATLIGIEYMIAPIHIIHYKTERNQMGIFIRKFAQNRADPKFPQLSQQQ